MRIWVKGVEDGEGHHGSGQILRAAMPNSDKILDHYPALCPVAFTHGRSGADELPCLSAASHFHDFARLHMDGIAALEPVWLCHSSAKGTIRAEDLGYHRRGDGQWQRRQGENN